MKMLAVPAAVVIALALSGPAFAFGDCSGKSAATQTKTVLQTPVPTTPPTDVKKPG